MDMNQLLQKLKDDINQIDGIQKQKHVILLSCLEDVDFIQLLTDGERKQLEQLNTNLNGRDIAWYKNHSYSQIEVLDNIYFKCLAYNNDKRKDISFFETKAHELQVNIEKSQKDIEHIDKTAKLISGASVLAEYAKEFDSQSKTHSGKAHTWLMWLIASIIVFVLLVATVLFMQISEFQPLKVLFADDLRQSGSLSAIVLATKAALVFGYLQIPYFLKRNYFAEKHLEQAAVHRCSVLKALHAVYNTIESSTEKDKIITTGAAIAFSEAESGYITRKEGAGSDGLIENLISKIWK